jgi:salicylate hydroxylase
VALEVGWEFRRWENGRVLFAQRLGAECERLYGEQCYVAHRGGRCRGRRRRRALHGVRGRHGDRPPRFSGMCAYRCSVPADRAPSFAGEDPLTHNGWIYGHDAENSLATMSA